MRPGQNTVACGIVLPGFGLKFPLDWQLTIPNKYFRGFRFRGNIIDPNAGFPVAMLGLLEGNQPFSQVWRTISVSGRLVLMKMIHSN
jgi:hypothetical protein